MKKLSTRTRKFVQKIIAYCKRVPNLQIHKNYRQIRVVHSKDFRSLKSAAASLIRENSMQKAWTSMNRSLTANAPIDQSQQLRHFLDIDNHEKRTYKKGH